MFTCFHLLTDATACPRAGVAGTYRVDDHSGCFDRRATPKVLSVHKRKAIFVETSMASWKFPGVRGTPYKTQHRQQCSTVDTWIDLNSCPSFRSRTRDMSCCRRYHLVDVVFCIHVHLDLLRHEDSVKIHGEQAVRGPTSRAQKGRATRQGRSAEKSRFFFFLLT